MDLRRTDGFPATTNTNLTSIQCTDLRRTYTCPNVNTSLVGVEHKRSKTRSKKAQHGTDLGAKHRT